MRIVETGEACGCGSTRMRIESLRAGPLDVDVEHVWCSACDRHLGWGDPDWVARRFRTNSGAVVDTSATASLGSPTEIRVGSDVYRKRADGSWPLEPERAAQSEPLAPPRIEPDPLWCESCARPRRERGEVRTHVWKCGCAVRPESVSGSWLHVDREQNRAGRGERGFVAAGHGVTGRRHPTEAGAIAAWRTALADEQRREDERAARPPVRVDFVEVIQGALNESKVSTALEGIMARSHALLAEACMVPAEAARAARDRKTTATMPAAQSAELARATVPAIDIDALSLDGLCELATELAKRHPERMREWRREHAPAWLDGAAECAWRLVPSGYPDDGHYCAVRIERWHGRDLGWELACFATEGQLRHLARQLSGESVSDSAFARSLAEVSR